MRLNKLVVPIVTGACCALIFGAIYSKEVAALCGYAEVTCTFPKKLRPDLHPDHTIVVSDGTNVATYTLTGNGTVTITLPSGGTSTATGTYTYTHTHSLTDVPGAAPLTDTRFGLVAAASGDGLGSLYDKVTAGPDLYTELSGAPPNQSVKISRLPPVEVDAVFGNSPNPEEGRPIASNWTQGPAGTWTFNYPGYSGNDGVDLYVGMKVLVAWSDDSGAAGTNPLSSTGRIDQGLYEVTNAGAGGASAVLVRSGNSYWPGMLVYAQKGTVNAKTLWHLRNTGTVVAGTTEQDWRRITRQNDLYNTDIAMRAGSTANLYSSTAPGFTPMYTHTMGQMGVLTEDGWGRISTPSLNFVGASELTDAMASATQPGLLKTLSGNVAQVLRGDGTWGTVQPPTVEWSGWREYLSARAKYLTGSTAMFSDGFFDAFTQTTSSQTPLGQQSGNNSWVIAGPGLARCTLPNVANQTCYTVVGYNAGLMTATPSSQAWYLAFKMALSAGTTSASSFAMVQVGDGTRYVAAGYHGGASTTYWMGGVYSGSAWSYSLANVAVDSTARLFEAYGSGTTTLKVLIDGVEFSSQTMPAASSWSSPKYLKLTISNGSGAGAKTIDIMGWMFRAVNGTL